ncbi:hypothetical protein YC2023_027719 [Brassica napus]
MWYLRLQWLIPSSKATFVSTPPIPCRQRPQVPLRGLLIGLYITGLKNCDVISFRTCQDIKGQFSDFFELQYQKKVLLTCPMLPELDKTIALENQRNHWLSGFEPGHQKRQRRFKKLYQKGLRSGRRVVEWSGEDECNNHCYWLIHQIGLLPYLADQVLNMRLLTVELEVADLRLKCNEKNQDGSLKI